MRAAAATALVVLALLGAAPPVRADDVAEAKARFRRGAELYRASRWREAIVEFDAAYRLKPHGAIHFNIAQCRERLGEWPGALRAYHDYLREVPEANDRAAVRASIRRIEERLAAAGVQALLVYSDPPGAEVRLDGRPRGATPFHIVLPPGTYALAVALDGFEGVAEDVEVVRVASRAVELVLRPSQVTSARRSPAPAPDVSASADLTVAPPPPGAPLAPLGPERRPQRRRVYTWVAAGTAAVAAAAGAYFGTSARRDEDAIGEIVNDGALADRTARSAESNARKANVLYAIGGGAAVAGATLFFVERRF